MLSPGQRRERHPMLSYGVASMVYTLLNPLNSLYTVSTNMAMDRHMKHTWAYLTWFTSVNFLNSRCFRRLTENFRSYIQQEKLLCWKKWIEGLTSICCTVGWVYQVLLHAKQTMCDGQTPSCFHRKETITFGLWGKTLGDALTLTTKPSIVMRRNAHGAPR